MFVLVREASPGWADDQEMVRRIVEQRLGSERAASVPTGLSQIWLPELDRVDRCTTCHVTIEWGEELADAPHPARSHPKPGLLASHPPERFGCTLCHGGQGAATTLDAAHGHVPHWEDPLLDRLRAERYELTVVQLLEMRCNFCHWRQVKVEGMPLLNEAKATVRKQRCSSCHKIHGEGKTIGPDLTRAGEKRPSHYAFPEDWSSPETAMAWHIEHFLDPLAVTPKSTMTNFGFSVDEAIGLSLLVLSWRRMGLPAAWVPVDSTAGK